MTLARPWLAQYPAGVPHDIDPDAFPSVVAVLQSAIERYRDRPAFSSLGRTITYGEVDALSKRFAAFLLGELGLKKGDRVAIMMPNCLQYPVATFGILRAGLTVVNVNPMYTPRELRHQLKDSGATAILVLDNFGSTVEQSLEGSAVRHVVTTGLGDMLPFPKGAIVNFVLKHVKKMVPDHHLPGAVRFGDALERGKRHGLPTVDEERMRADVERAYAAFRAAGVHDAMPYFRFPGGCHDTRALKALVPAGVTAVQWDVVSGDAFATDARAVARDVLDGVRPGSVVVLHCTLSAAPTTERVVRQVVPELRREGYRLVKVSELIGASGGRR